MTPAKRDDGQEDTTGPGIDLVVTHTKNMIKWQGPQHNVVSRGHRRKDGFNDVHEGGYVFMGCLWRGGGEVKRRGIVQVHRKRRRKGRKG